MLGSFASCVMFTKELEWETQCDVEIAYVMGKLADFIQIKIQLQLIGVLLEKGLTNYAVSTFLWRTKCL